MFLQAMLRNKLWRFGSPSTLLLALLLFPLPLVEIRCSDNAGASDNSAKKFLRQSGLSAGTVDQLFFWEWHSVTLLSQSGLQAARGIYYDPYPEEDDEDRRRALEKISENMYASPLMVLYPLFVVGGMTAGLKMRLSRRRLVIVSACSVAAFFSLVAQMIFGFPLLHAYLIADDRATEPISLSDKLSCCTVWYLLAMYAVLVSLFLLALEWYRVHRSKRKIWADVPAPAGEPAPSCASL